MHAKDIAGLRTEKAIRCVITACYNNVPMNNKESLTRALKSFSVRIQT